MSRQIRFDVTDEKWAELEAHVKGKGKWKTVGEFARYSTFKEKEANKAGSHRRGGGVAHAPQSRGNPDE